MDKDNIPQVTGAEDSEGASAPEPVPINMNWDEVMNDLEKEIYNEEIAVLRAELEMKDITISSLQKDLKFEKEDNAFHFKMLDELRMKHINLKRSQESIKTSEAHDMVVECLIRIFQHTTENPIPMAEDDPEATQK